MPNAPGNLDAALADRYAIQRELGQGGMATVYLATDLRHDREVALKVLRPDLAATLGPERFLREIHIAAKLQHPNILPVHDSGEAGGFLYYVMPFVEGLSLRERLSGQGELPVPEAVRILRDVADALAHAHSHGVLHRDIKPENIMLTGRHALVADFGVAKAVSEATGRQVLTTVGVALGTPAYMPPEQAAADPHTDHRADIYAFGVTAYELLAGRPPFTGITAQAILAAHMTEAPTPVSGLRPLLPQPLAQMVMRCLEKKPADRPQSADELLQVLESLATPSVGTAPTQARLEAAQGKKPRNRALMVGAVFIIVLATGFALWQAANIWRGSGALALGNATQLTAEQGLEVHPAISPDGRFVAYAAGNAMHMRIYIRPVTGGRTIALSEDSVATEFQPRWSPDGNQILYLTPGGAFVASPLGGSARLVAARSDSAMTSSGTGWRRDITAAAWAPDSRRIAVAYGGSLSVMESDGSGAKVIATSPQDFHSCDWSPAGAWIACVSGNYAYFVPGAAFGNIAPSAIALISAAGGVVTEVTDRTALHQSPVWSPGGERLYFVSNRHGTPDIYVMDISGSGRARGEPRRVTTGLGAHSIAFSGDGRRLAYATYTARANVWSVAIPSGGAVEASSAGPVTTGNQVVEAMSISPDGRWLLYDSNLHGNADIFRVPIAGGMPERLTTDSADDFAPALSPDGRELAYHSWRTGTRDIFVQPLAGGAPQQVTNTAAQESFPVWSPDGRAIAFFDQMAEHGVERGAFIVRRDASGAWSAPVTRREEAVRPSWVPGAESLLYARNGAVEIIPADSGLPRTIYAPRKGSDDPIPEMALPSAEGRTVYFKSHDHEERASIWSVPLVGGRPRLLVRFGDPSRPSIRRDFGVGAGRFFFTLEERESDIWVVEVSPK